MASDCKHRIGLVEDLRARSDIAADVQRLHGRLNISQRQSKSPLSPTQSSGEPTEGRARLHRSRVRDAAASAENGFQRARLMCGWSRSRPISRTFSHRDYGHLKWAASQSRCTRTVMPRDLSMKSIAPCSKARCSSLMRDLSVRNTNGRLPPRAAMRARRIPSLSSKMSSPGTNQLRAKFDDKKLRLQLHSPTCDNACRFGIQAAAERLRAPRTMRAWVLARSLLSSPLR